VVNLFALPQLNHHTEVQGGVLADACGRVLRDFFAERRAQKRAERQAEQAEVEAEAERLRHAQLTQEGGIPAAEAEELPLDAGLSAQLFFPSAGV